MSLEWVWISPAGVIHRRRQPGTKPRSYVLSLAETNCRQPITGLWGEAFERHLDPEVTRRCLRCGWGEAT